MDTRPGFIDLQVNGFLGVNFSSPDLSLDDVKRVTKALQARGTVGFLATMVTSPPDIYRRNLPIIAQVAHDEALGRVLLGVHIEGPFISDKPGAVGAHDPASVSPADVSFLEDMVGWANGTLRLLTVAAEVPGIDPLVRFARDHGITVSIGHSLFDYDALSHMASLGATALTHLGNGLPNQLHRHHNPIWAGAAHDDFSALLITDGHHLPYAILTTLVRAIGTERLIVVSDASPIAGMPPGRYHVLGNDAVLEPSGRLYNPEKDCLVGSTATMRDCINHLASLGLLSSDDLWRVGFDNPLQLIDVNPESIKVPQSLRYDGQRFVLLD
jgi:N-acetylglucosamine-6-phosphate deacetylase